MTYHLADQVRVRLAEATPITGGMIFHISTEAARTYTTKQQGPGRRK